MGDVWRWRKDWLSEKLLIDEWDGHCSADTVLEVTALRLMR